MKLKSYFSASRDSKEGVKQEFLAAVDDAFMNNIQILDSWTESENYPAGVLYETDSDIEAMKIEARWFLSGSFGNHGTVVVE